MLKKQILIPYEKYEKLINQGDEKNVGDALDGQCISHNQHFEVSRDKRADYGLDLNKAEPTNANFSLGMQRGEGGGIGFNAEGNLNNPNVKDAANSNNMSIKHPATLVENYLRDQKI